MGAVLAATAGVLLAVFQAQLLPIMGWRFLIPLFAAVILGIGGALFAHHVRFLSPLDAALATLGGRWWQRLSSAFRQRCPPSG